MIPDQLRWAIFRRRRFQKMLVGFKADVFTYATPDCEFDVNVVLHRGSKLFSSRLARASYVAGATLSNVTAGKFCSIGQGSRIGLGQHPGDFLSTHPAFYSGGAQTSLQLVKPAAFEEALPVILGNDVWVGANALIMGGVSIGNGAIIGAGSVVTKDIPAYAIAVGTPARVIRYRFDEQTISALQNLEWWNKTDQEIRNLLDLIAPSGPVDPEKLERLAGTSMPFGERPET